MTIEVDGVAASGGQLLQIKTDLSLELVNNTSDANKPVSIAGAAAIIAERVATAVLTGKTISGAANTLTNLPAAGISGVIPIANLATGTPNGAKFLRDDGTLQSIAGGGDALVGNPLSQFAATTSAQLRGVLTDETGSGSAVFNTSPNITTPTGIVKGDVGLGNVDNTSDVTKNAAAVTLTNKTLTSAVLTTPTVNGAVAGTATLPATITMLATPAQADNSGKIATTAYVDTLGATKVTQLPAGSINGANTLTQATHFNRHLSWTGAVTAAQAISPTASAGDFVEVTNDGTSGTIVTFTGVTVGPGMKAAVSPTETFQAVYSNGAWVSETPAAWYVSTVNPQSANYTLVATDAGATIYHPASDATPRTWTIPANASVPFDIGVIIVLDNDAGAGAITVAITTDTLVQVGSGTTGSYTLPAGARAVIEKVTATRWRLATSVLAGDALVANPLSQFAATTSAQLLGVMSDETGTGSLVFGTAPVLSNPVVGTQAAGDNSTKAASTAYADAAAAISPINSQSAAYTLVLTDAGKTIYHPSADTTARTWTVPANASVAIPIGAIVTIDNDISAGVLTIAITTDTMVLVGSVGSTGSRTLAAGGRAVLQKVTATRWRISGGAELT